MNSQPEIGGRAPLAVDVEAGKSYWWCACCRSKTQPFCDGSQLATEQGICKAVSGKFSRITGHF
jgi:CDGSH-type Zn-finger protein